MSLPLEEVTVLEFSQYLAGPYAGLRLADLGARVIKIERPNGGDPCRQLALKNILVDGDSLVFHAVNRGKESVCADLKNADELAFVKQLIAHAEVLTHNFRPGVMEKLGLSYEEVKRINPSIVYGSISGYGREGPWCSMPGQDLLAQARSGLTWLTGDAGDPPTPFGLAVADIICGNHFVQAILAALLRRARTGEAIHVEVSLMESLIDLQFEVLTTFFHDNRRAPERAAHRNAHAYLGAPYGIYDTRDGYIALAMGPLGKLASILDCDALLPFTHTQEQAFDQRDQIRQIVAAHLKTKTTDFWLNRLEAQDYWCADVYTYAELLKSAGYLQIGMEQTVYRSEGAGVRTLRCPIRIDGERLYSSIASPRLCGEGSAARTLPRELAAARIGFTGNCHRSGPLPLEGILIVDFSQFLSGPSASLRLADLGARVIKIERPGTGDICRQLYISNVVLDEDSTTFHAINRNKESFAADLKYESNRRRVRNLLAKADVVVHNFRPGVMERLGFGYSDVRAMNGKIVYGAITGYGTDGPWSHKPGQDLLLQSLTGLTWLSGNAEDGPVAMGLSICDMLAGAQLAQGVLACLLRRGLKGTGGLVEVSLLEAILDFQVETLTTYFQDGGQAPLRTALSNGHAYLGAPYGIYATQDGFLALAMGSVVRLGELLECPGLLAFPDPKSWFERREEIKAELASHLSTQSTAHWLALLVPADIWCAEVLNWNQLTAHPAYRALDMEQTVYRNDGLALKTTRLPMRFNGVRFASPIGSPKVGEHTEKIVQEFLL